MRDELLQFLDRACLTYSGNDSPERRDPARARIDGQPDWGREDLHVAAALGRAQDVAHLLEGNRDLANRAAGPRAWPALLYLCYSRVRAQGSDYLACARSLLDAGADPAASFSLGPCHMTALTGVLGQGEQGPRCQPSHPEAEELARLLLERGAPANQPQALYNTMFEEDDRWLRLLIEYGLGPQHTIDWDMETEARPRTFDFLLAFAVSRGFAGRVQLLLERGADPNVRDPYTGRGLVTQARLAHREELAQRLIAAGADPQPRTPDERLRLACHAGDVGQARAALAEDGSLHRSPPVLHDFAARGDRRAVELLLDLGWPCDGEDRDGATALHRAALAGARDVALLLLEHGADARRRDRRFSSTSAEWARHGGHTALAEVLSGD